MTGRDRLIVCGKRRNLGRVSGWQCTWTSTGRGLKQARAEEVRNYFDDDDVDRTLLKWRWSVCFDMKDEAWCRLDTY